MKSSKKAITKSSIFCPCDSGKTYTACCEIYHLGLPAPTAEALMRSRYTAYVFALEDYLLQTWHTDTRPHALNLAQEDESIKWLGLQVKHVELISESRATVEFVARYKIDGKATRLSEISQFVRLEDRWYYLTGNK